MAVIRGKDTLTTQPLRDEPTCERVSKLYEYVIEPEHSQNLRNRMSQLLSLCVFIV